MLGPVFFQKDIFIYVGYGLVILSGLYLYKTQIGLNLRAIGENPAAADAASVPVTLYKYLHLLWGGALCGLGGAYLSLVYVQSWQTSITAGMGWIAVALVIFSTWNPYKVFLSAYLFGGLSILGFRLQSAGIHISQHLLDMAPHVVTIVVLVALSMDERKALDRKAWVPLIFGKNGNKYKKDIAGLWPAMSFYTSVLGPSGKMAVDKAAAIQIAAKNPHYSVNAVLIADNPQQGRYYTAKRGS